MDAAGEPVRMSGKTMEAQVVAQHEHLNPHWDSGSERKRTASLSTFEDDGVSCLILLESSKIVPPLTLRGT